MFTELVSRYQRELYNYLRRFLADATLAEDVFQATFLQVHVKRDAFEQGRKFRPWLYTIATNQAIDAQRRNRRHRRLSLNQPQTVGSENVGTLIDLVAGDAADPAMRTRLSSAILRMSGSSSTRSALRAPFKPVCWAEPRTP